MARFNSDSDRFRPVAVLGLRGGALFALASMNVAVNARAVAKREDPPRDNDYPYWVSLEGH